jgi:Cu(I)/Ag(I) efflux system membrane protein CusA/SilA
MLSFFIRNPFVTLTAAAALALAGLWAWRHVPVDALPDLSDNQVIVWAEWPGKSPQDVDPAFRPSAVCRSTARATST